MNAPLVWLILAVAAEPSEADQKKYEEATRNAINATAAQIDGCTDRYLVEQPGTKGIVKVSVKIVKGGAVGHALAETSLTQPRSLKECLERIARTWRLPEPETDQPDNLSLEIPVRPGAKFKLYGPDEQPPPKANDEPQGFLQFTPQFLRNDDEKE